MARLERFYKNGKFGYVDQISGEIIIPEQYEDCDLYFGADNYRHIAFAAVKKQGKYGVINENGTLVIPCSYLKIEVSRYAARVKTNTGYGILSFENESIIPCNFESIECVDSFFKCKRTQSVNDDFTGENNLQIYNLSGKLIYNGDIIGAAEGRIIIEKEGKYGVLNADGELILPCIYDQINCFDCINIVRKNIDNDKWFFGVVDNNNNIIIDFKYQLIEYDKGFYHCYKYVICETNEYKKNDKRYYYTSKDQDVWCNHLGEELFTGKARALDSQFLCISNDNKCAIINYKGDKIVNFLYENIIKQKDCFVVFRSNHIGLIGHNGTLILDAIYNRIETVNIANNPILLGQYTTNMKRRKDYPRYHGYCKEYCFDTEGHKNENGFAYDDLIRSYVGSKDTGRLYPTYSHGSGIDLSKPCILYDGEAFEIYTEKDGIIGNSRFDYIQQITPICFVVRCEGKYGVYRLDVKKITIPCEYDRIQFFGGHTIITQKDGLWGAQSLVLKDGLFNLLFNVDIPNLYHDIKILDDSQLNFGIKVSKTDYKGNVSYYYTICNRFGEIKDLVSQLELETQFTKIDDRHFLTSKCAKYGTISLAGYPSIPFIYDSITIRTPKTLNVCIDKCWGIIRNDGSTIVPIRYAYVLPAEVDLESDNYEEFIIAEGHSYSHGVINQKGEELIPPIYPHLMKGDNGFYYFGFGGHYYEPDDDDESPYLNPFTDLLGSTWGCLNHEGKVLLEAKYDYIKVGKDCILGGTGYFATRGYDDPDYLFKDGFAGTFDLYSIEGEFLFGGFRSMFHDQANNVYAFLFGGEWREWNVLYDEWSYFDPSHARWLFTDGEFKSIIRNKEGKSITFGKGFIGNVEKKIETKSHDVDLQTYGPNPSTFKDEKKVTFVFNMPLDVLSRGFESFGINSIIVNECIVNGWEHEYAEKAAIDIHTGTITQYVSDIKQVTSRYFYYANEGKCGIRTINEEVLENKYLFLTFPVHGYVFGASEISDSNSIVKLFKLCSDGIKEYIAIRSIKTEELIKSLSQGGLLIESGNENIEDLKVAMTDILDSDFVKKCNLKESGYKCSLWESHHFYGVDSRLRKPNYNVWGQNCYDNNDDYYSQEDSLMDALDGEPDAYWNIRD